MCWKPVFPNRESVKKTPVSKHIFSAPLPLPTIFESLIFVLHLKLRKVGITGMMDFVLDRAICLNIPFLKNNEEMAS